MIDKAIQNLGIILAGGLVLGLFYGISKLQRLYHDHHDYRSTMASGSRDPKAKMHEIQQARTLTRWQAAAIATVVIAIILLCLS